MWPTGDGESAMCNRSADQRWTARRSLAPLAAASAQAAGHDVADVRRQRRFGGDAPQHRLRMAPSDFLERAPGSHCGQKPRRDLRIGRVEKHDDLLEQRKARAIQAVELSLVSG